MTGPFHYEDRNASLGVNSDVADQEFALFRKRSQEILNQTLLDTLARTHPAPQQPPPEPPPNAPASNPAGPGTLQNWLAQEAARRASTASDEGHFAPGVERQGLSTGEYHDLLDAANYWQIPADEARRMDPLVLKREIEQRRQLVNRPAGLAIGDYGKALVGMTAEAAAGALQGTANLVGLVRKVPFAGDWLANASHSEMLRKKLEDLRSETGYAREEIAAGMPLSELQGYAFLQKVGQGAGFMLPATATWEAAGAIGGFGVLGSYAGRISPFARAAIKGYTTGAALSEGSDETRSEKTTNELLGAGLAVGGELAAQALGRYGPALQGAVQRVRQALGFDEIVRPQVRINTSGYAPQGQTPGTVDAEWQFEPEQGLLGRGGPTLPPGPGAPPSGGGLPAPVYSEGAMQGPAVPMPGEQFPADIHDQMAEIMRRQNYPVPTPGQGPLGPAIPAAPTDIETILRNAPQGPAISAELSARIDALRASQNVPTIPVNDPNFIPTDRILDAAYSTAPEHFGPAMEGATFDNAAVRAELEGINNIRRANIARGRGPILDNVTEQGFENLRALLRRGSEQGTTPPEIQTATKLAENVNKQSIVTDSPMFTELSKKPSLDDGDVASAAVSSNPGGVTLIRGVGMPEQVVQALKVGDTPVRFALRPGGGLDALVGEGVTQDMAEELQRSGMFRGQRARTADGAEVTIVGAPDSPRGVAMVRPVGSTTDIPVEASKLTPGRFGGQEIQAPREWDSFRGEVLADINKDAAAAGMEPVTSMTDSRVSSVLQSRLQEWFDQRGLRPGERQVMQKYFESRWADEYRQLAPEDSQLESLASIMTNEAYAENAPIHVVPTEEHAESKGFIWQTKPGGGGTLHDMAGDLTQDFRSDAEAEAFVAGVDRDLPDLIPPSDVPPEMISSAPGLGSSGSPFDPGFGSAEQEAENMATALEAYDNLSAEDIARLADEHQAGYDAYAEANFEQGMTGGSGGGLVPPGASTGGTAGFGDFLPPRLPSGDPGMGLAEQFRALRQNNPNAYHLWRQKYVEGLLQKFRPARYRFLSLESSLNNIGIDRNRTFDLLDNLYTGTTIAHNESAPWHEEVGSILAKVPRQVQRTGDWARAHEIQDPVERQLAFDNIIRKYDLSHTQAVEFQQADRELTAFIRKFFFDQVRDPTSSITMEREIFRYVSHIRGQQAVGAPEPFNSATLPPELDYFAEHVRAGNMQFRKMDMRELMYQMINARFTAKHMGPAWQELRATWGNPEYLDKLNPETGEVVKYGIPREASELVMGYARLARYGQDMGQSAAVRGLQAIMRTINVPISAREAATIINTPLRWNYEAMLGAKLPVMFRDAIQPLKAGAKVGMPRVADVYRRMLTDPAYRAEVNRQGIQEGWIERDRPQFEGLGTFEAGAASSSEVAGMTQEQLANRERFAQLGDLFHDNTPVELRQLGKAIRPLHPYAKLSGEVNRGIAGRAGYEAASEALAKFRAAQNMYAGVGPQAPDYTFKNLMEDSSAGSFEGPIRDKFWKMVQAGDDEGAATFIGRQVADWSQGRYGIKETMEVNRGFMGRVIFQFGNFAPQELESIISMTKNGSPKQRAMAWLWYGGIHKALALATVLTGWSFYKWQWARGIAFGGGPLIDPAIDAYRLASGVAQSVGNGTDVAPGAQDVLNKYGNRDPIAGLAGSFFPYAGYFNTANDIISGAQGANPTEQIARSLVTGDRGSRIDFQREMEARLRNFNAGVDPRYGGSGGSLPGSKGTGLGLTYSPVGMFEDNGVADPSKITTGRFGDYPVYSTENKTADGKVPTHRLDIPSGRLPGETWEKYEQRVKDKPLTSFSPSDLFPVSDVHELDPQMQEPLNQFLTAAKAAGRSIGVNETYRPQSRQELLFKRGRGLPGGPVTWTLTSDHTTRRAADLRGATNEDYAWIQENAPKFGLNVLGWDDPGHVSIPLTQNEAQGYAARGMGSMPPSMMLRGVGGMQ